MKRQFTPRYNSEKETSKTELFENDSSKRKGLFISSKVVKIVTRLHKCKVTQ